MYTRKHLLASVAILPLFSALTLTASPAASQNDHYPIPALTQAHPQDSLVASHLQVAIKQTSPGEMKFRIAVASETDRVMSIAIQHGHDLLFQDLTGKPTYENIFNLSDLEDGDYTVLVTSGKEKITRIIHIQTQTKIDRQLTVE